MKVRLHESAGESVGEVWLEADVKEANHGQNLVDWIRAFVQPEVLEKLEDLL